MFWCTFAEWYAAQESMQFYSLSLIYNGLLHLWTRKHVWHRLLQRITGFVE